MAEREGVPLTPIRVPRRLRTDPIPIGTLASLRIPLTLVVLPDTSKNPHFREGFFMAEREGVEPSIPCGMHAFQACALGHYATSPSIYNCAKSLHD